VFAEHDEAGQRSMDSQEIKSFIDAMAASDLDEMEVSHDGWTLRLVRRHAAGPAIATATTAKAAPARAERASSGPAAPTAVQADVLSPLFGVVHLQQAPGEPPLVRVGQAVEAGSLLCIIEAMKVFNEVRAERAGTVTAILVKSGQEVEAGDRLLRLE
jgi:acetyl-CoA carboxylase biotin carboxyl carrier protein